MTAPFLVSSAGRYVWSDRPFVYAFTNGVLTVSSELLFSRPQWNNWIEIAIQGMNQASVDAYTEALARSGFPCGVYIMDGGWLSCQGSYRFHAPDFPGPKGMFRRIREKGWKSMVWTAAFVSPDSREYKLLRHGRGCRVTGRDVLAYDKALAALHPMMQFSAAPWRYLSPANVEACRAFAELHVAFAPYILDLARQPRRADGRADRARDGVRVPARGPRPQGRAARSPAALRAACVGRHGMKCIAMHFIGAKRLAGRLQSAERGRPEPPHLY